MSCFDLSSVWKSKDMHCYAEKNSKYSQLSHLNKPCWVISACEMTSWVKCQTSCQLFFSRSMNVPQTLCLTESLTFITNYKKICFISLTPFLIFWPKSCVCCLRRTLLTAARRVNEVTRSSWAEHSSEKTLSAPQKLKSEKGNKWAPADASESSK